MLTIGIDCGLTGGIACLREDGSLVDADYLPIVSYHSRKWVDAPVLLGMLRKMRQGLPARAVVENIHAMPKMGAVANNSKGMTLGSTLATLQLAGCGIELVEPSVWKRAQGLLMPGASDTQKKQASLRRARLLYPRAPLERACDDGIAEAILIAHYAQRNCQGELGVA